MDSDLRRLKSICKWCNVGTKILSVIIVMCMVASAILMVAVVFNPDILFEGSITIDGVEGVLTESQFLIYMTLLMFMLLVALAIVMTLGSIFKSIYREYSPFIEENYRRFRRVAELVLLTLVFIPIRLTIGESVDVLSDVISTLTVTVLIYVLALIFHYGQYLQKESDETL